MLTIDLTTARRFILGKQGLWPGRRWRGLAGADRYVLFVFEVERAASTMYPDDRPVRLSWKRTT